jgi:hypothetical protein
MNKKAQASIDYISTYGWALIAMTAALGALYLFTDVQNIGTKTIGESCTFGMGELLYCQDAQINKTTSIVYANVKNTLGTVMNVSEVFCTYKSNQPIYTSNNIQDIQPGALFQVRCEMAPTVIFTKKAKVDISIVYKTRNSPYPSTVDGSIVATPMP